MEFFDKLKALVAEVDAVLTQIEDDKKAEYQKGFDAGVAQAAPTDAKIYTQEDMDKLKADYDARIEALESQVAELTAKMEGLFTQEQLDEKIKAVKADIYQKYLDMQVVENNAETGFESLIKPE